MKATATDVTPSERKSVERGGDVILDERRPDLAGRAYALGDRQAQPPGTSGAG